MLKLLLKDTVIYGVGNALKKFIGLLLLPFYAKALTPSDYGVLETMGVFVFFLTAFMDLGLNTGTARYYYQATTETEKGRVLFTGLMMRMISFIPSLTLAVFSNSISIFLFDTDEHTWVVFLSCLLIPVSMLNQEQTNLLRYLREPWKFNIITLLRILLSLSLGISLVVILKKGPAGAQLAGLASSFILFVFSFVVFNRGRYVVSFSWYWCKKLLNFGFPLIWASLALWVFQVSDRYILLYFHETSDVGLYSIAFRFSQAILILNMAVDMSFKPAVLQSYEAEDEFDKPLTKKLTRDTLNLYNIAGILLVVFVSVFSVDLVEIISTREYRNAALAIPALAFGALMFQSRGISAIGIGLKEKTQYLMWILVVVATLNVLLNILIIPDFSFEGAAFTTMVSSFAYFLIAHTISTRLFDIKAHVVRLIVLWSMAFIVSFLVPWLELTDGFVIPIFLKPLIVLSFLLLPLAMGFVTKSQIEQVRILVRRLKR